MNKKIFALLMLGVVSFCLSGCASIVHGIEQPVSIHSIPEGASIEVDGQQLKSPSVVRLKGSSSGYVVHVTKPGYKPATGKINSSIRVGSSIVGNLLWLIPGVIVDYLATGAAFELDQDITIPMEKA